MGAPVNNYNARRCEIDESAYDHLDETKAYTLGWLWADGWLTERGRYWQLGIEVTDRSAVELIRKTLRSTHKITRREPRLDWHKPKYSFTASTRQLAKILKKYNWKGRPNIPKDLVIAFVRGLFDGDGTVFIKQRPGRRPQLQSAFYGREEVIVWLKRELEKHEIVGSFSRIERRRGRVHYMLRFSVQASIRLYKLCWTTKGPYLKRKAAIFKKYLEDYAAER